MSPWAPRRPCPAPGCGALIGSTERRCAAHEAARLRAYRASRPAGLQAFYNSTAWKSFRAQQRAERIVCECAAPKCPHQRWSVRCTQPTVVIDHLVEPWRDWSRALDPTNVQGLCSSCHSSKTARTQSWHRS